VKEDTMSTSRRRTLRQLALAATTTAAVTLGPVVISALPATAVAADCCTAWGSLVKQRAAQQTGEVTGVRSGRHACFDRLVIDLGPGEHRPGFRVQYVDAVHQDGSDALVPLRGGARLQVVVLAPSYDEQGDATYTPADTRELVDVGSYTTFRQVSWAGSFEGTTTLGLGVRARLPMRTFTLAGADGSSRLVVDGAHHW
jgi:hypothetical protein